MEVTNCDWGVVDIGAVTSPGGSPTFTGVVFAGDYVSLYPDGAASGVYISRVISAASNQIYLNNTAKMGTAPSTAPNGYTIRVGGAWAYPPTTLLNASAVSGTGDTMRVTFLDGTITTSGGDVTARGYTPGIVNIITQKRAVR